MRILGTSCPPALYEHPLPDPSFLKHWFKCARPLWGIFADLSQQVGLMLGQASVLAISLCNQLLSCLLCLGSWKLELHFLHLDVKK